MQNITVNFSQSVLKQKGQVNAMVGYQRDDLDGSKIGTNKRNVVSVNATYMPGPKLYAAVSYSNFTTFMNIKPVFQQINQVSQFQITDTLNFQQITQNASLTISRTLRSNEKKTEAVNLMASYMDAANRQAEVKQTASSSRFYNVAGGYSVRNLRRQTLFSATFNMLLNNMGGVPYLTLGPTLVYRSKVWKKVEASLVTSFNQSRHSGVLDATVLNARGGLAYELGKKQQFSLDVMNQYRSRPSANATNDMVLTAGYNFRF